MRIKIGRTFIDVTKISAVKIVGRKKRKVKVVADGVVYIHQAFDSYNAGEFVKEIWTKKEKYFNI
jgi:hypothetical protein